jgi:transcriptional regulator with XRE-family HTH domain
MAMTTAVWDAQDQRKRRRRARVTQAAVAGRLGISTGALSEYESGKEPLPWELTPDDYEHALAEAIVAKRAS